MDPVQLDRETAKRMGRATLAHEKLYPAPAAPRRGPRNTGGAATNALTEDDDRRSCDEALAWNFSGETIEPMHVGWLDRDTNTLDAASDYGDYVPNLYPITVVEAGDIEGSSLSFVAPETFDDDDLLLVYSIPATSINTTGGSEEVILADMEQYYDANGDVVQSEGAPFYIPVWNGAANGQNFQTYANWWDELLGATGLEIGAAVLADRSIAYVVLRGVKRTDPSPAGVHASHHGLDVWAGQYYYRDPAGGASNTETGSLTASYPESMTLVPITAAVGRWLNSSFADLQIEGGDGEEVDFTYTTAAGGAGTNGLFLRVGSTEDATGGSYTPTLSEDPLSDLADDNSAVGVLTLLVEPVAPTTTTFPNGTCNPLVMTELRRVAALEADDDPSRREATELLNKEKRRYPLPAKAAITNGSTGTVIRDGYTTVWAYRRNLTDTYLGAAPWNAMRSTSTQIGTYYYNPAAGENSGVERAENFQGRQQMLYSQAGESALEVLRWGRDVLTLDAGEITVTMTATKTSGNTANVSGTWDNVLLSTGYDQDLSEVWTRSTASEIFSTAFALDLTLTEDGVVGAGAPLYGLIGAATQPDITSTNGKFTGTLALNRYLLIAPTQAYWGALDDDTQESDTFVFETDETTTAPVAVHPWYYVDPVNKVYSGATYTEWPEAAPAYPLVVPEGTDITIDAAFDPYFARKLGFDEEGTAYGTSSDEYKRDQRLGLQLAFVRFKAHPYDKQCC